MTENVIDKLYAPRTVEEKWYMYWLQGRFFHAVSNSQRKPFCIMMPPPNVTGVLHMGHALQGTLQDAFIRFYRMEGYETLWQSGTDHAGIATQNVVEKKLTKQNIKKEDLGREKFLEEVWKWKEQHGNIIRKQWEKLGCSCDWDRDRFTMDSGLSRAVVEVFYQLYKKGLIYRGKYIVNWCPRCITAISDEEVQHKEVNGNLWTLKYHVKGTDDVILVATTRPETMLGDTAVAVNPEDKRYKNYIGKTVILPLQNREIPIIADYMVDSQFGTGAVKVTPAHDPNDFIISERHQLPKVIVIDEKGIMTKAAGNGYAGFDRLKARKMVLHDLKKLKLLVKTEDYTHSVGHCSRCGTVIEPSLSTQWFVKMKPLAEKAIKAVQTGDISFHPKRWEKIYFDWLENIRDWCISRQLWWGHRIPVWYCQKCDEIIVERETPKKCPKCNHATLRQDEDVLDTWFSSWLWPFSTLGWPENTPELSSFYPTSLLVSGYDIIFFWIARMIMAGLEFTGQRPFKTVYITGMIKDELGRWMSKSLGNGIDPLEMIEQYGADSVRYSLVALATEGQDIRLSKDKFEMGRNFANKVWNTFRFLVSKREEVGKDGQALPAFELMDKWVISRMEKTITSVRQLFDSYRLNEAITTIYNFLWHEYCDWYLELMKDRLGRVSAEEGKKLVNAVAIPVFENFLKLLHPFMPFITEEIWQSLSNGERQSIMISKITDQFGDMIDETAESIMTLLQEIITAIRNIRGEMNILPNKKIDLIIVSNHAEKIKFIQENQHYIQRLARVENVAFHTVFDSLEVAASAVFPDIELYVPLKNLIDIDVEKARLTKEIQRLEGKLKSVKVHLGNHDFIAKAPPEVVEREKSKGQTYEESYLKLRHNLGVLEGHRKIEKKHV